MAETDAAEALLNEESPSDVPNAHLDDRVLGEPSVVVDDVYVTYRVFGGRPVQGMSAARRTQISRVLNRSRGHVGAITEVPAVRGVSFEARRGESIGIVGTNGSGKSTLLRAIAGLIPLQSGAVYVSGDPTLLGVNAVLMNDLTGRQNIVIGGLALGLSLREAKSKVGEVIDFSDIGQFVDLPMMAYSSGMGARLRFAISSLATPDILMIDEALGTGDAAFREKSKERIEQILEGAGTIFLVSHSAATVKSMCNRGIWLDKGKIVMDGDVEEVCDAYESYARSPKVAAAGAKLPARKK